MSLNNDKVQQFLTTPLIRAEVRGKKIIYSPNQVFDLIQNNHTADHFFNAVPQTEEEAVDLKFGQTFLAAITKLKNARIDLNSAISTEMRVDYCIQLGEAIQEIQMLLEHENERQVESVELESTIGRMLSLYARKEAHRAGPAKPRIRSESRVRDSIHDFDETDLQRYLLEGVISHFNKQIGMHIALQIAPSEIITSMEMRGGMIPS